MLATTKRTVKGPSLNFPSLSLIRPPLHPRHVLTLTLPSETDSCHRLHGASWTVSAPCSKCPEHVSACQLFSFTVPQITVKAA